MAKKYISLSKLSTFLDNLRNTFAELSHKHTLSDMTDYAVDTELSSNSFNPVANSTLNAEFDAIGDAMGALELSIDSHNHDDVYYIKVEVDSALSQKSQVQIITWEDDD